MSDPYIIHPTAIPTLPVSGASAVFPVHRIYCVGRNYAAHAREMGGNPEREAPFFFSKPGDAVIYGPEVAYPGCTQSLHHEVELVVAIGQGGSDIAVEQAEQHIFGYATGVDLTRRDLQAVAKQKGRPWDVAKGFDQSAPVSMITPVSVCGLLSQGGISLEVDGTLRQQGDLSDMIWNIPEVIAELSRFYALKPGDLIFTGTPEGVSELNPGNQVKCQVQGLPELEFRIV